MVVTTYPHARFVVSDFSFDVCYAELHSFHVVHHADPCDNSATKSLWQAGVAHLISSIGYESRVSDLQY